VAVIVPKIRGGVCGGDLPLPRIKIKIEIITIYYSK